MYTLDFLRGLDGKNDSKILSISAKSSNIPRPANPNSKNGSLKRDLLRGCRCWRDGAAKLLGLPGKFWENPWENKSLNGSLSKKSLKRSSGLRNSVVWWKWNSGCLLVERNLDRFRSAPFGRVFSPKSERPKLESNLDSLLPLLGPSWEGLDRCRSYSRRLLGSDRTW